VDGRAGSLILNEGNIVRAGGTSDSTLLVINQVRPIYVSFTVPQQQLPSIRRYMLEGTLGVSAAPAGDPRAATGVVTFVDNLVDAATGTIRLKATFPNDEGSLWPGQFANVTLTLASEPDSIVVPSAALQSGPQGAYVFVAKPDSTVENRRVTVARTQGNETVIAKGLQAGEKVVTDGQPRLTQGAKIEIRTAGGPGGGGPGGGGRAPGAAGGERPAGAGPPAGAERPADAGRPPGAEQRPAADSAGASKTPPAERPRTP
jgi:multidrug efflux system membrane fusion protein